MLVKTNPPSVKAGYGPAGYLMEERRRWPVITASPRGQCSNKFRI